MRCTHLLLLVAVFIIILLYFYTSTLYWDTKASLYGNMATAKVQVNKINVVLPKKILLWDKKRWESKNMMKVGNEKQCGYCNFTMNKSEVDSSAIVIFSWMTKQESIPKHINRSSSQLFIWFSMESPANTMRAKGEKFLKSYEDNFFNATFTFRRDSTFYNPVWNWLYRRHPSQMVNSGWRGIKRSVTEIIAIKTTMALWVVSNCNSAPTVRKRLALSDEMIKYGMKIDRFGRCFNTPRSALPERDSNEFIHTIEKYKFYLAFENSNHCRDYITEKFFSNSLIPGAVPIVYGPRKQDYKAVAPPHSFIHVEDFDSTESLVKYILYLDKNNTAYAEYLAWREQDDVRFDIPKTSNFCTICRASYGISLNDTRPFDDIYGANGHDYSPILNDIKTKHIIPSIHEWWLVNDTKECLLDFDKKNKP